MLNFKSVVLIQGTTLKRSSVFRFAIFYVLSSDHVHCDPDIGWVTEEIHTNLAILSFPVIFFYEPVHPSHQAVCKVNLFIHHLCFWN